MDVGWFEDLIAMGEGQTLTEAAERRHLSQPAFSRRIQAIELWLGAPVIDRTFRPARLVDNVFKKLPEIRFIVRRVNELRATILAENNANTQIAIASLHSIATGFLPNFLVQLQQHFPDISTRLIAAEREECYSLLMTRQVPLLVVYETAKFPIAREESLLEKRTLRQDPLIPIASKVLIERTNELSDRSLPIIAYPENTFFGSVLYDEALPQLDGRYQVQKIVETVLVPAALEFALAGLGVAWIPLSLVGPYVRSGRLLSLRDELGSTSLTVVAARRDGPKNNLHDQVWEALTQFGASEQTVPQTRE